MSQSNTTGRQPDYPVESLILERWSPRSFSAEPVTQAQLMSLFEAARWAPSASNTQPWRFAWALRGDSHWSAFLDFLVPANQRWAQQAGALLVIIAKNSALKRDSTEYAPLKNHAFDTGAAWANLALQAHAMGLATHAMGGFDAAKVQAYLKVPGHYTVQACVAVGQPGPKQALPDDLQARETPSGRNPVQSFSGHGELNWD
ncbi:nitroreductase family protein [Limnobacter humi]|uniref:Nitroreductase family protein n=1 Tax=Limnobacter humi TaxID=1778671 RepID=A0ABT1WBT2_9BURK|nr:nitroreductase family protein [Limnobacter humi]MCQ8894971.1 nitroreductase family protein [Limnobacter humi]